MNSRRAFREIVKTCREGSTQQSLLRNLFRALLLFILFFSMNKIAIAQTTNQQYDLNDPRNPDCPCHKLQKQADDEYQRQLNLGNNFNDNDNIGNQQLQNFNPINTTIETNKLINFNQVNNNLGNDSKSKINTRSFQPQSNNTSSGSGSSVGKNKKKKASNWFVKKMHRTKLKHSRIKKVKPNYAVCYKW
ncbi:hypothetical protein BH10BAC1_BH10BAC1_15720 [soil metagenome]